METKSGPTITNKGGKVYKKTQKMHFNVFNVHNANRISMSFFAFRRVSGAADRRRRAGTAGPRHIPAAGTKSLTHAKSRDRIRLNGMEGEQRPFRSVFRDGRPQAASVPNRQDHSPRSREGEQSGSLRRILRVKGTEADGDEPVRNLGGTALKMRPMRKHGAFFFRNRAARGTGALPDI